MNPAAIGLWLGLSASIPLELGDRLEPGLYSSARVLEAYALVSPRELRWENEQVGEAGVWINKPLTIAPKTEKTLRLLLMSAGVYLAEVTRIGAPPCFLATRTPGKRPPPEISYQLRVLRIAHVDAERLAGQLNEEVDKREKGLPPAQLRTRFTGDRATGKLIIRYTSEDRLREYLPLVETIDVPLGESHRPVLKRWRARSVKAAKLEEKLRKIWKEHGRAPLHVVLHAPTNSLLFRVPEHLWADLETVLDEIDPAPDGRAPSRAG